MSIPNSGYYRLQALIDVYDPIVAQLERPVMLASLKLPFAFRKCYWFVIGFVDWQGRMATTPDTIRTCDLSFRKAALYPTELRGHRLADLGLEESA